MPNVTITITGNIFPNGSYEFEILNFSFGVEDTGTASSGGGGSGKAVFSQFNFLRQQDALSPLFYKCCASGLLLPAVQLALDAAGGGAYLQILLKTVLITSYQISSSGDTPTESFSLEYEEIQYETLNADGSVAYEEQFAATWG